VRVNCQCLDGWWIAANHPAEHAEPSVDWVAVVEDLVFLKITHEELARRLGESKLTVERIAMGIFSPEPKAAAYLTALWIVLTSKPIAFMPIRRKP